MVEKKKDKRKEADEIMTTEHKYWKKFVYLLQGSEGCDGKEKIKGNPDSFTWKCNKDLSLTKNILKKYFPNVDVEHTLQYFEDNGAYCDCEILFNIESKRSERERIENEAIENEAKEIGNLKKNIKEKYFKGHEIEIDARNENDVSLYFFGHALSLHMNDIEWEELKNELVEAINKVR